MASDADPYRTLGLTRGASLDDVRSAYRRLAKANHPDRAGEAALPRFLAIQAAYDQIAGPDGGPPPRSGSPPPSRPWSADPDRSGATHRAYSGRARRTRASAGPRPGPGSATGDETRSRPDAGPDPASRQPGRPPNKATLGSTSYDGVDAEAFEPDWGGASWYGTTSGTYWTLNPKEYADPRKHGPEYQARARRQRKGVAGEPAAAEPAAAEPGASAGATLGGPTAPDPPTDAPAAPTHTTASWWEATAGDNTGTTSTEAGATTGGHARPAGHARPGHARPGRDRPGPGASGRPGSPQTPSGPSAADISSEAVLNALRIWLGDGRPGVGGRVGRAVVGWAPIALGIGWLAGEITGCGRFSADCDPAVAPVSWLAQIVTLVALILVPGAARVATAATIATLAAVIPGAILLLATHDPGAVNAGRSALGGLMIIAWGAGIAYGLVREGRFVRSDRGPGRTGPVS